MRLHSYGALIRAKKRAASASIQGPSTQLRFHKMAALRLLGTLTSQQIESRTLQRFGILPRGRESDHSALKMRLLLRSGFLRMGALRLPQVLERVCGMFLVEAQFIYLRNENT